MGKILMNIPEDEYEMIFNSDSEVVNASSAMEDYLDALPLTKEQYNRVCALVSEQMTIVRRVAFMSGFLNGLSDHEGE